MSHGTKTPEDWLLSSEAEEGRGRFKVFLGYAPGVGKTFSMLSEGIRRRSRGEDVVIGIAETHGRAGTAELARKLEQVERRELDYKGTRFTEMSVDAILARLPQVVLVDELAHTNIEGSRFPKRYEDVLFLLDHKIDVLSTVNIQHVESLAPRVQSLTGISVREQVPDWVLDRAEEIVISDLTPEALVTRMRRYLPDGTCGTLAGQLLSPGKPDCASGDGAPTRDARGGPEPGRLCAAQKAGRALDRVREGSCVHQCQPAGTGPDCTRGAAS